MTFRCFITALLFSPLFSMTQVLPKGLQVNEKAPAFAAKKQYGEMISLQNELKMDL